MLKPEPTLAALHNAMGEIGRKLDSLILLSKQILEGQENAIRLNGLKLEPDSMALSIMPAALRKTVMALYKLEKATALDISRETKRLRAVESASANQLVRMGYLKKKREGRDVYFYIESSSEM